MSARMYFGMALVAFFLIGLAGCNASGPPRMPPEEILQRAVDRMQALQSFQFAIDRDGLPAYLNPEHTLGFSRAEGAYNAPDRARAAIRVIAPGLVVEVQMVALGDEYWESGLLSGKWQKLPAGAGFNPAILFNPQSGFQAALRSDLHDLEPAGVEELPEMPGRKLYLLRGIMDGERLYDLSYGLIGPQAVQVRLWVAPETFEVQRIEIDEPPEASQEAVPGDENLTRWRVDFWDFDRAETVNPPPGG